VLVVVAGSADADVHDRGGCGLAAFHRETVVNAISDS
jgi:hypothetical protein